MQRNVEIFAAVAQRVTSIAVFNQILQKQQNMYDIQPYKIENTQGQTMLKIYISLNNRHNCTNERDFDSNNWNQNERRVFVWFIISYTYFLQLDKKQFTINTYDQLSGVFFGKKSEFLHFQHLNLLKNKHRITWTEEEDQILEKCIMELKAGKWNQISKRIFYDSNRRIFRTPKHCRQRWLNHLDKNKKHGEWTTKEDLLIVQYVLSTGKRWSKIVPLLSDTRTEHMIKNRYNSLISKTRGGKKIKEEEIAKKIFNSLSQTIQGELNSDSRRQSIHQEGVEGQKNQILVNQKINSLESLNQSTNIVNSSPLTFNSPIQMGCFLDYNCFYFPSLFFNQNRFGVYQFQNRQNPMMEVSKNSSFSIYQPKINYQTS